MTRSDDEREYEYLASAIRSGSLDAEVGVNPDGSHETDVYLNMSAGDSQPAIETAQPAIETAMVTQEVRNDLDNKESTNVCFILLVKISS